MAHDPKPFISHSIVVNASVETLYDMVADVTRMGEWSRTCIGATWDDGAGPMATEGSQRLTLP